MDDLGDTDPHQGDTGPPRSRAAIPSELGRFRVLRPIGAGGMGVVYVAYDPELDRKVAVKLLHPSVSGSAREAVARARLVREAKAMARLSHPNVVAVYDVGTYRGQVFLAMEFIEGVPLSTWLRGQVRSRREIVDVFVAAGRGLAAAHREGLVHGDFKPDNVLVDRDGRARVVDFGLSFAQDREPGEPPPIRPHVEIAVDTRLTPSGTMTGTPAYLSPEQFHGAQGSAQADQFSFCVSLYEGLYGQRPFRGDDVAALREAVARGVPPEPRDRPLPAWLRRILLRGLDRDPARRFADMDALLAALERDPERRRRRIVVGVAIVVALVAAALAYRWLLLRDLAARRGLCAGAADELAGVWDGDRRARAEQAFRATALPYADDAWAWTAARLDAHAAAWMAMHTEACEATHLRGEQSPALLDRRMICLRQRLGALRSLVDVLVDADAGVVENAAAAVAALPALDGCADAAALLAGDDRPASAGEAGEAAAIRERLTQARALMVTARYQAGRQLAAEATRRAAALADRALLAEARLTEGELLEELGDPAATAALDDAFYTAAATRDDALTARVALAQLFHATALHDLAAGDRWARHARALLDRLEDARAAERRALAAEYVSQLGTLHVHAGRLEEAEAAYRDALARVAELPGDRDLRIAGIHNNLGNLLVRRGDLERATSELGRAAALSRQVLGPRHPRVAIALNNLGEVAMRRGAWEEARATYEEARAILVAALGPDHPNVGVVDNNLGVVDLRVGDPAAASARFERARAIFRASFGDDAPPLAYPLTGLGEARLAAGDPGAARELLERALALRDAGSPTDLARTRLALARALPPEARERALDLARGAHAEYAAAGPAYARERDEAAAWLRAHADPPAP